MIAGTGRTHVPAATVLDLGPHRDNAGCALPGTDVGDGLDGLGRAFPADQLRDMEALFGGWPAGFGTGGADNVVCLGQRIDLPSPGHVLRLGVLGACTGGSYTDDLVLQGPSRECAVPITLTDFLAATPAGQDSCAVVSSHLVEHGREIRGPRPRMWLYETGPARPFDTVAVRLPVNPDIHVFGLWVTTDSATGTLPKPKGGGTRR